MHHLTDGEGRVPPGLRTVRRVMAAAAGVLFLALATLFFAGFGGLGSYPRWIRLSLGGLVAVYGLVRLRGALRGSTHAGQN